MKLLDKSVIQKEKSNERRVEIEEGMKIAKKVDSLRELVAKEQENARKFREETIQKVTAEVAEILRKKDEILKEVSELEEKRKKLLIPLDAEWDKVRQAEMANTMIASHISEREGIIEQNEKQISKRKKDLEIEERRISEIKANAGISLSEAQSREREADKLLRESMEKSDVLSKEFDERKRIIFSKEEEIRCKEIDLDSLKNHLEEEKIEIIKAKAQIADQRGTLERAFARLNKK